MREDDLNPILLQAPNPLDGLFRLRTVRVDATRLAVCVEPFADLFLPAHDAAIMAGIARKVDPLAAAMIIGDAGEEVDVALEMARRIDDIEAAISKYVKHSR